MGVIVVVRAAQSILVSEKSTEKFMRAIVEVCAAAAGTAWRPCRLSACVPVQVAVEHSTSNARPAPVTDDAAEPPRSPGRDIGAVRTVVPYHSIDAVTRLIGLLVKVRVMPGRAAAGGGCMVGGAHAVECPRAQQVTDPVAQKLTTLVRFISNTARVCVAYADHQRDTRGGGLFDARPFFRIFSNILHDVNGPEAPLGTGACTRPRPRRRRAPRGSYPRWARALQGRCITRTSSPRWARCCTT
jgi:hypothetical protein